MANLEPEGFLIVDSVEKSRESNKRYILPHVMLHLSLRFTVVQRLPNLVSFNLYLRLTWKTLWGCGAPLLRTHSAFVIRQRKKMPHYRRALIKIS